MLDPVFTAVADELVLVELSEVVTDPVLELEGYEIIYYKLIQKIYNHVTNLWLILFM